MMSGAMAPFGDMLMCVATIYDIGPVIFKLFMLNSTVHEICHTHKGKMSIIIGIVHFMSMKKYNIFEIKSRKRSLLVSILVLRAVPISCSVELSIKNVT